jgi:hypothetical protein
MGIGTPIPGLGEDDYPLSRVISRIPPPNFAGFPLDFTVLRASSYLRNPMKAQFIET